MHSNMLNSAVIVVLPCPICDPPIVVIPSNFFGHSGSNEHASAMFVRGPSI